VTRKAKNVLLKHFLPSSINSKHSMLHLCSILLCLCKTALVQHIGLEWIESIFLPIVMGVRARGWWSCSPPDSGKTIIFQAKAKFFGQKPTIKNEK